MSRQSSTSSGGIGLGGLLFITFLVLKLTKVIDWSWWWVTAPLWGPIAIILAGFVGYIVCVIVRELIRGLRKRSIRQSRPLDPWIK